MQTEVDSLLSMDGAGQFHRAEDSYGYHWLVIEDADIEELVTRVHMVNSSLADSGWGPQLLCSVFGVAGLPPTDPAPPSAGGEESGATPGPTAGPGRVIPSTGFLVYLFKRGTFYPFIPTGHEQRDTEEELRLKSLVADDLVVEPELDRWFPLWDLPVG
jgi:hypothetical protein